MKDEGGRMKRSVEGAFRFLRNAYEYGEEFFGFILKRLELLASKNLAFGNQFEPDTACHLERSAGGKVGGAQSKDPVARREMFQEETVMDVASKPILR